MSETDPQRATDAATAVFQALQPLTPDERARVIQAAAALFGVTTPSLASARATRTGEDSKQGTDEDQDSREAGNGKRQSLVEFLNEKRPATNSQRIACFAHYREHVEGKGQNFSQGDFRPYFAPAKLPKPGNYDRDFRAAVSSGWIHEDGANSYLTRGGEEAVAAGFGGKGKPRGAAAPKKKKSGAKGE